MKIKLAFMTIREFKELALSFPNTIEAPHFDRTAFKVIDKRILLLCMKRAES
jgi:hypothetical protein